VLGSAHGGATVMLPGSITKGEDAVGHEEAERGDEHIARDFGKSTGVDARM
jgi:hypothetical protein